ncbi:MAG TPA: adenylate/guanylate cyclase domain-containing protein [Verrucomicrobiae bacterium]|nr:adenylate/guanylate cyclase domain-containing protein [Verrucomicrobiae bacterium]
MPARFAFYYINMEGAKRLLDYLNKHGVNEIVYFSDGALINPVRFPIAALETNGAILFADLPGFSKYAAGMEAVDSAYLVNNFFAWFEGEALRPYGGIVDKFIGDAVMVVFLPLECKLEPLEAAMQAARAMLERDPYSFRPKIGIAFGPIAISLVGTENSAMITTMGHTVNLASRCVSKLEKSGSVRIASNDIDLAKKVFKEDSSWKLSGPKEFSPKNMPQATIIDVERTAMWVPNWNYSQKIKEGIKFARDKGAVKSNF